MGTKTNPGEFDCYAKALPDEPMFTILSRDPDFYEFVTSWAQRRRLAVRCGERPQEDIKMVLEAEAIAIDGQRWRRENLGKWRKSK